MRSFSPGDVIALDIDIQIHRLVTRYVAADASGWSSCDVDVFIAYMIVDEIASDL